MPKAPSAHAVEITKRELCCDGYLRVERLHLRHARFDGDWTPVFTREVMLRGRAAAVLPYDPMRDLVLLVEQFRAPAYLMGDHTGWMVEPIAGLLDHDGETAEEVARREAMEEAGITLGPLHTVARVMPSAGATAEWTTVFCALFDAKDPGGVFGQADEHEDIRTFLLPAPEAFRRVRALEIENGFAVMALQWLQLNRRRLRRAAGKVAAPPAAD